MELMANSTEFLSLNVMNPNPLDFCVSLSLSRTICSISPMCENASSTSFSVALKSMLPTKIL
uniref:Uncharacterized protein n=1 Tax=Ciona intestinalis TaxID=7719 RepID=H2XWG4_CIOIN